MRNTKTKNSAINWDYNKLIEGESGTGVSLKPFDKYLVVVECTDAGGFEIGMAISRMGYRPLFLLNSALYKGDIASSLQNFEYMDIDTFSADTIAHALAPIAKKIIGITTLVDSRLAVTAEVAKKINIPGPDPACIILKDKSAVADMAKQYSLITTVLPDNKKEAIALINKTFSDKKIIAKKRNGCGAVGIALLETHQDKINFIQNHHDLHDWIFQEYFQGNLFSMEGWVANGKVHFLGWTSRRKINNTETEFRFEGYNTVSDLITHRAKKSISSLLKKANYKRGWFHIEFLINSSNTQLMMIDANVGRTGGAMLPHVLAMALSSQPVEVYQHAIELQVFGKSDITFQLNQHANNTNKIYKCICFGSPQQAVIEQVLLPENPLQVSGLRVICILGEGDTVTKIGQDDWSWIGFVAGQEKMVDDYAAKIKIKTKDGNIHHAVF